MKIDHDFKKKFGQNFLRDSKWADKMITTLGINPGDKVIEIGPGNGVVTEKLINSGSDLYSVEIDYDLVPLLLSRFSKYDNFHLINSDVLNIDVDSQGNKNYKIIGSLPYNISKRIISKFLSAKIKPEKMVFIIQKEVALDYTAKKPKSTFLSNYIQLYSSAKYICRIPNHEFYPTPEVDGAVIKFFDIKEKHSNPEKISQFIKHGFSQPRKKLTSSLKSLFGSKEKAESILLQIGLNINMRPSELDFEDWIMLYNLL